MHSLEPDLENEPHKLLLDFEIGTDPLISPRQPGQMIVKNNNIRTSRIVDYAV